MKNRLEKMLSAMVAAVTLCLIASDLHADDPTVVGPLVIKLIDQVEVPALEAGPLNRLQVKVGDQVRSGDAIAGVDERSSAVLRDLAEIELAVSRQKSEQYRNDEIAGADLQESQAAAEQQRLLAKIAAEKSDSEVQISAAEKAEAVAKNEWTRAEKAHAKYAESVSKSELEGLRLKYERARLERIQAEFQRRMDELSAQSETQGVKVAELAARRAELRRSVAVSDAEWLRFDIQAKQKTLEARKLTVSRHQVTSPIDGTVVEIYKRTGEWVQPGDSVARVINLEQLHAEGFLSGHVRPEQGREVRLFSGDKQVEGVVDFVSPERDQVSGEFRFLVRFKGGVFLPGDRVEIAWTAPLKQTAP